MSQEETAVEYVRTFDDSPVLNASSAELSF